MLPAYKVEELTLGLFDMDAQCLLHCPVCRAEFDWLRGYGREIRCCSKECHDEAEWRRTLAIMGKTYRPRYRPTEVAE